MKLCQDYLIKLIKSAADTLQYSIWNPLISTEDEVRETTPEDNVRGITYDYE